MDNSERRGTHINAHRHLLWAKREKERWMINYGFWNRIAWLSTKNRWICRRLNSESDLKYIKNPTHLKVSFFLSHSLPLFLWMRTTSTNYRQRNIRWHDVFLLQLNASDNRKVDNKSVIKRCGPHRRFEHVEIYIHSQVF